MLTIGMLGGMSWESSAEYYRLVNEAAYSPEDLAARKGVPQGRHAHALVDDLGHGATGEVRRACHRQ